MTTHLLPACSFLWNENKESRGWGQQGLAGRGAHTAALQAEHELLLTTMEHSKHGKSWPGDTSLLCDHSKGETRVRYASSSGDTSNSL